MAPDNGKRITMAALDSEQEVQRICIALTQDKEAYLLRYRGNEDFGGFYWTLSSVQSLRDYATSELKDTRVEKELKSLSENAYDKVSLQGAAWEVRENLVLEMCDREILRMDEENHRAYATEIAYAIGEQLIKKWNL